MQNIDNPIIIIGTGHSGTRLFAKALTELGSSPGKINNEWYESELYLNSIKEILALESGRGWDDTIFDTKYLKQLDFKEKYDEFLKLRFNVEALNHYFGYQVLHWHWKVPMATFLISTWKKIYPNAYYLHVTREIDGLSHAFIRRGEFRNKEEVLEYDQLFQKKVKIDIPKNYLKVSYETYEAEIEKIVDWLPWSPEDHQIESAKNLLGKSSKNTTWNSKWNWKENVVNLRHKILRR